MRVVTSGGRLTRFVVASDVPPLEMGGGVVLTDGTSLTIDPIRPGDRTGAVAHRRHLSAGVPIHGVIENGRLVALATRAPLVHPVDIALLRLAGCDVDGALRCFGDEIEWHADGFDAVRVDVPTGFWTKTGRLSATTQFDGLTYNGGVLSHPLDLLDKTLPASVLAAASGRPLSALIDVPRLRGLDPTIVSAYEYAYALDMIPRLGVALCDEEGWRPMERHPS